MSYKHALFDLLAVASDRFPGRDRSGRRPLFIVGQGRSGTSWVGHTFSQHPLVLYYREPCHFHSPVDEETHANFNTYITAGEHAGPFKSRLDAAMSGRSLIPSAEWVWQRGKLLRRLSASYRIVIKEVATILSVEWVRRDYAPDFLILFRHPCSIALSEVERGVDALGNKEFLLRLIAAFEDHLGPYEDVIRRAVTPYEIFGAIYGARNRILANFIERHRIGTVVLYEDLCREPLEVFRRMFGWFGFDLPVSVASYIEKSTNREEPGTYTTTKDSAAHIERWKRVLTQEEAFQVRDFVLPFDLPYYRQPGDYLLS